MDEKVLRERIRLLEAENDRLRDRERDIAEQNEELLAQKEELTAAIEAFIQKRDSLFETVEQLRQRNFELDQILYRTSHDLRSPITSIKGLLAMMDGEELSPQVVQLHEFMMVKVHQMNALLDALSMLAHASFDQLKWESAAVGPLVDQIIGELNFLPQHSWIKFQVVIEEGLRIETDVFLFSMMLRNLIANAVTFREPAVEGVVAVSVVTGGDNAVLVSVRDDGEGILPEVRSRIFDMFFRGSERSTGNGLGLYIVKCVVERFGGNISFESFADGTTFSVMLPHNEGVIRAVSSPAASDHSG